MSSINPISSTPTSIESILSENYKLKAVLWLSIYDDVDKGGFGRVKEIFEKDQTFLKLSETERPDL